MTEELMKKSWIGQVKVRITIKKDGVLLQWELIANGQCGHGTWKRIRLFYSDFEKISKWQT